MGGMRTKSFEITKSLLWTKVYKSYTVKICSKLLRISIIFTQNGYISVIYLDSVFIIIGCLFII